MLPSTPHLQNNSMFDWKSQEIRRRADRLQNPTRLCTTSVWFHIEWASERVSNWTHVSTISCCSTEISDYMSPAVVKQEHLFGLAWHIEVRTLPPPVGFPTRGGGGRVAEAYLDGVLRARAAARRGAHRRCFWRRWFPRPGLSAPTSPRRRG